MATIQTFEDLICWKKARLLTKEVYSALLECKDSGFKNQIQRAAISVMSNIAEGFERGTRAEFLNYLYIAKGSAGEVRAQLYAACDIGYLNIETFKYLNSLVVECSKLLSSFIKSLKQSDFVGLQHKKEKTKQQLQSEEINAIIKKRLTELKKEKI
ncbi:MAG: S23 ribosomal protein [Parcubacteria group bacterium Gr01-1014_48]|nr:MAG: S23 ribosomal protein [Parcubacteria group bacterium Greene0416_14]TSC74008.1 MAG: S23 ribosomal protein [Parcubacteria group bacterium Gr01-1014_48]TSD00786.1 MAG: S23 ribosomal protein [Parcubacteria group bacterium Greene1014_15]TSD07335.1 MAG: S23 ribosomal protein [Parcubacteria group bacterium Greene0714_4]